MKTEIKMVNLQIMSLKEKVRTGLIHYMITIWCVQSMQRITFCLNSKNKNSIITLILLKTKKIK